MLTRDAILAAADRPLHQLDVPEWGGCVYIREPSAQDLIDMAGGNGVKLLLTRTVCDETGKRLFTDKDADALMDKGFAGIQRVVDFVNGLVGAEKKTAQPTPLPSDSA